MWALGGKRKSLVEGTRERLADVLVKYVHPCVCPHTHMCAHAFACAPMHDHTHVCVPVHMHMCAPYVCAYYVRPYMHVCVHAFVCLPLYVCVPLHTCVWCNSSESEGLSTNQEC